MDRRRRRPPGRGNGLQVEGLTLEQLFEGFRCGRDRPTAAIAIPIAKRTFNFARFIAMHVGVSVFHRVLGYAMAPSLIS
jgi:hypothetical protein